MPTSSDDPRGHGRMTRRDFSRRAAQSAAGTLLCASLGKAAFTELDEPPTTPVPEEPAELSAAFALARAAAPHLPPADIPELKAQVKAVLAVGQRLRGHAVPDGLEPDSIFQAAPLPEPRP